MFNIFSIQKENLLYQSRFQNIFKVPQQPVNKYSVSIKTELF